MARGCGVDEGDGDVAGVPVFEILLSVEYARARDGVEDAVALVLEPVADEYRVALGLVNEFSERLDLLIVDGDVVITGFVVDGAAGELLQLQRQGGCVGGVDGVIVEVQDKVTFECVDVLASLGWELDGDVLVGGLWQLEVVGGAHADGDVGNVVVDGLVRAGAEVPVVDDGAVAPAWCEVLVTVVGDVFAEALAVVDESERRPDIQQGIGGWGAGKAHDAVYLRANFLEGFEAFRLRVFKAREFVDDDHVVGPAVTVVLHKPGNVFSTDGVDVGLSAGGGFALFCGSDDGADGEAGQVVPFVEFCGPCVAGDSDGCDDENLLGFEAVADEVVDGGEGGDCFPHAHS